MLISVSYAKTGSLQTIGGTLIRGGTLNWQTTVFNFIQHGMFRKQIRDYFNDGLGSLPKSRSMSFLFIDLDQLNHILGILGSPSAEDLNCIINEKVRATAFKYFYYTMTFLSKGQWTYGPT